MAKAKQGLIAALETAPTPEMSKSEMDKFVQEIFDKKTEKGPDGKIREVMIPLTDIVQACDGLPGVVDVRVNSIVTDHVDHFYGLFCESANPNIPAIYLECREDKDGRLYFIVVDGRHRTAGARKAGVEQIRAIIFYGLTAKEKRTLGQWDALRMGMMLSGKDLAANVLAYMKKDVPPAEIRKLMSNVPKTELEKAMRWGSHDYTDFQLNRAIEAVNVAIGKGQMFDPRKIAEEYGIKPKRLQDALGGKKKGVKNFTPEEDPTKTGGRVALAFKKFQKYLDTTAGEMIQHSETGAVLPETVALLFKRMYAQISGLMERVKQAEGKLRSLQFEADEE